MNAKLQAYRRNGVQEYLVWQIEEQQLVWFELRNSQYMALKPDADGVLRSEVFPGLWLDVTTMLREDLPAVIARLQQGLQTAEYAEFSQRLKA